MGPFAKKNKNDKTMKRALKKQDISILFPIVKSWLKIQIRLTEMKKLKCIFPEETRSIQHSKPSVLKNNIFLNAYGK